ncbi:MAG: M16 family metallopeptidase [Egibacteraceae bacterium]
MTTTSDAACLVPPLGPPPRVRHPDTAARMLASGLRLLVARQPNVPLVEVRLRVPFAGTAPSHPARANLLSETLLSGTALHSQAELAEAFQSLGTSLWVSVDADWLLVGGAVLRDRLPDLLELIAEVLTCATYPAREVAGERDRLREGLSIARAQPAVLADEALRRRMFGNHPYALQLPEPDAVSRVTAPALRRLHAERMMAAGSVLVLVGDLSPSHALDHAEAALDGWRAEGDPRDMPVLPRIEPGPTLLVRRPGSVQSSIRMGGAALRRDDPAYPALELANLVFGGCFSSRLVENVREDKGYTYGAFSRLDHGVAGSTVVLDADVATEVTAPALLEISYELGRIATLPVTQSELDDVRQYAIGTLARSIATQTGLAATLSTLAGVGLGVEWLRERPARLARVTVDDVAEVAQRVLAPSRMVTVVLGDIDAIEPSVAALGPVERARANSG